MEIEFNFLYLIFNVVSVVIGMLQIRLMLEICTKSARNLLEIRNRSPGPRSSRSVLLNELRSGYPPLHKRILLEFKTTGVVIFSAKSPLDSKLQGPKTVLSNLDINPNTVYEDADKQISYINTPS